MDEVLAASYLKQFKNKERYQVVRKWQMSHISVIIWLNGRCHIFRSSYGFRPMASHTADQIDSYISAQLPDPLLDRTRYEAVAKQILIEPIFAQWIQSAHGKTTYGFDILLSSTNGLCDRWSLWCYVFNFLHGRWQMRKFYPKDLSRTTTVSSNGHVIYAQPNNNVTVQKNGIHIDNRFVVLHNVDLCVKYDAHINVESVNHDGVEKYLFKYTNKLGSWSCQGCHPKQRRSR
jgi:hypothetical protein